MAKLWHDQVSLRKVIWEKPKEIVLMSFELWPLCLLGPQMFILVSLRYLQTAMEGVLGEENVEIETEGYILEKGVKETLLETKEKIMKFLQFAQVGDASNATQGTEPEEEKPATA